MSLETGSPGLGWGSTKTPETQGLLLPFFPANCNLGLRPLGCKVAAEAPVLTSLLRSGGRRRARGKGASSQLLGLSQRPFSLISAFVSSATPDFLKWSGGGY